MVNADGRKKQCSELPEDVLILVQQRLPISSLCRFRVVSKHWNMLPTLRPEDPYLLDIPLRDQSPSRLRHCSLYSPLTNQWDVLDLSFLPSRMAQLYPLPVDSAPHIEQFCSDGGLLCLQARFFRQAPDPASTPTLPSSSHTFQYSLFVCNPLTRSCKRLPFFPCESQISNFNSHTCVDLIMHNESSGRYKIFAVTKIYTGKRTLLRLFMYDSVSDRWKMIRDLKQHYGFRAYLICCCSAVFGGVYYFVSGGGSRAFRIFAYNIAQDSWIVSGVKMKLPDETLQVFLVVINECLHLIASVVEKESWFFKISKVDLSRMDDLVESVVFPPASIPWDFAAAAVGYRDSILWTARFTFKAVIDLHPDLKELKAFPLIPGMRQASPTGLRPPLCQGRASFDVQATI